MPDRTVYIVDDNAEFLASAQWWLKGAGFDVQGFDSPVRAIEQICSREGTGKACLLLDVRMPEMSGLDLHDALHARGVELPIIYITGHADVPLAVSAMQKGAITFLEKPFADEALETALEAAFSRPAPSAPITDAAHTEELFEPGDCDAQTLEFRERCARLTPRERQVLDLVIEGRLNKTIGDALGISVKTVELHRSRVMEKLVAKSLTQLIKMMMTGKAL
jgi:two-component system, LuxR family, response regulator FixJ